ncbi:MAG: glycosyltransferase family 2 protein [Paludibacteraceae bacterium]
MSKVYVIIVTYNGKQWYDRCFSSLRASELPVEVIVIDNASSDDTVTYIKQHFPEVQLMSSDTNLGFGQANNKGMRYALDHGADYVFLLNQDAWIEPETIKELVSVHQRNKEYGVLSPMHLNADKTAIEKGLLGFLTYHEHINKELISDFYIGPKNEVYAVREVNAAAWLLPRYTLETVGGFDPIFFHYGEDDNYLSRVLFHGLKVGIVPKVTICHDTERRLEKTKAQQSTFEKWLLQRATDLVYPQTLKWQMNFYYKESIKKLFFLNFKSTKINWSYARYLKRNSTAILFSIQQNKKRGTNWI